MSAGFVLPYVYPEVPPFIDEWVHRRRRHRVSQPATCELSPELDNLLSFTGWHQNMNNVVALFPQGAA